MTRATFLKLVDEALLIIPREFRDALQNIAIVVEDEPSNAQLAEVGIEPPDTLLGLYQGTPLTERQWAHGNTLPDKVTLFQGPIEDSSEGDDDVVVAIGETLIHEIGHYFGLSEEEIEEIEERYTVLDKKTGREIEHKTAWLDQRQKAVDPDGGARRGLRRSNLPRDLHRPVQAYIQPSESAFRRPRIEPHFRTPHDFLPRLSLRVAVSRRSPLHP
jgi:predicted Zn-dependent protease with MMP-like domain